MKILHHNDDDGRLAAAIVNLELIDIYNKPGHLDFIEYNHGWELDLPEVTEGERVYIVDLAMNDTILNAIKYFLEKKCRVIHIDHHHSGIEFYNALSNETKNSFNENGYTHFFVEGVSGCMLTYIYSLMNENERFVPESVKFDFSHGHTHVRIGDNSSSREYRIPHVVRYVDDNDVWRHEIPEAKYFNMGFQMHENKHPFNDIWQELMYEENSSIRPFVENGRILFQYQENQNKSVLKNAFEADINGIECLALNTSFGNSRLFSDKINEYPFVCKYAYDGSIGKWRYTLYSSEECENYVDVSEITKSFGGGGHIHAAGFVLDHNLFDNK